jgi:parallel beta-helix repeat protein
MIGGSINGNTTSSTLGGGGGVYSSGTFTMSGGTINGNTASSYGGGVYGTFTMSGGAISGNTASTGGGVSGPFMMSGEARVDLSNEVLLFSSAFITLSADFTHSDDIAVIDLWGTASDWLGKEILKLQPGYTGPIPNTRFKLGNFVGIMLPYTKTPIVGYKIDSTGKLAAE